MALSRALYPKQFLVLQGNQSLFQQAHLRLQALGADDIAVSQPCVVGNEEHRFLVLDQLREVKGHALVFGVGASRSQHRACSDFGCIAGH